MNESHSAIVESFGLGRGIVRIYADLSLVTDVNDDPLHFLRPVDKAAYINGEANIVELDLLALARTVAGQTKQLKKLQKKVDAIYYAPEGPAFHVAKQHFNNVTCSQLP
jgi:hypothetical protein